jgi:hypothetical protein
MNAIFDRVIKEFSKYKYTTLEKMGFQTAFGNRIFSRLINDERSFNKNGIDWVNSVVELFER